MNRKAHLLSKMIFCMLGFLSGFHASAGSIVNGSNPVAEKISIISPVKIASVTYKNQFLRKYYQVNSDYQWKLISTEIDSKGNSHSRYQQYYQNCKVENAIIIFHDTKQSSLSISGTFEKIICSNKINMLSQDAFLDELSNKNLHSKNESKIDSITGVDTMWVWNGTFQNHQLVFAVNYFPENDLHSFTAYVDATDGTLLSCQSNCNHVDVPGVAHTAYHGTQNVTTTFLQGNFVLKCSSKGNGIETKNLNGQLNYSLVSEFTDGDNLWEQTSNFDENHATDAHYCAEQYYDFLNFSFNRNSIDNNGYKLVSYLNYGSGLQNAFWNGQAVVYGSGVANAPMTTLDIAGHEFTHGLIQKTAQLNYSNEPGTLNEALADIFGTALEFYSNPSQANWTIGESSGLVLRSMSQPELYNQPSNYHGTNWYFGTGDNGGVHINSGFINRWFYLLTIGGQGINEQGWNYSIQGIGMNDAMEMVYHTLIAYTLPATGFDAFKNYTLQSCVDLFGSCSPQYVSVLNAWKAVGLINGNVQPGLSINSVASQFCDGDSVLLTTSALPGSILIWYRNGNAIDSSQQNYFYAKQDGIYHAVEIRCGMEIISSPLLNLAMNLLPAVSLNNAEGCSGIPITLSGIPAGGIYSVVNPYLGNSVSYEYIFTDVNGCTNKATAQINVYPSPEVFITNTDINFPVNHEPVHLHGNVNGIFSGPGVIGNYFHPETLTENHVYPIRLEYVSDKGCAGYNEVYFMVEKPCIRNIETIQITMDKIDSNEQNIYKLHLNASPSDFNISWNIPDGCELIKNINDTVVHLRLFTNSVNVIVSIENACGEAYHLAKKISTQPSTVNSNWWLWPNPAKETVFIFLNDDFKNENCMVTISDAAGKTVKNVQLSPPGAFISLENINSGVYSLQLQTGSITSTRKLVIN